ncbi:DUF1381 domain-containing protein [Staphylococcus epidermidis]|uniref:DUF1381 domain-containing protein n=1 Tax=Staphylococcus epidermidis TaxID=1282 RepID=UPI00189BB5D9|nr:DUF1381 domain-containing protein [Staphylococcus epidermidis]
MTQYLIREFTDSTGHIHQNIEKARFNEKMTLVEANSKEEANIKRIQAIKLPNITIKDRVVGIAGRFFKKLKNI